MKELQSGTKSGWYIGGPRQLRPLMAESMRQYLYFQTRDAEACAAFLAIHEAACQALVNGTLLRLDLCSEDFRIIKGCE
jgi:hypothetical protein